MFLSALIVSSLVAIDDGAPAESPPPLKTITTVKASPLCKALRTNVFSAIDGLRSNDMLAQQGRALLVLTRRDARAQPLSLGSSTGGAGVASELDDMRLYQLEGALAQNIEKIQTLLDDKNIFVDASTAKRLEPTRAALMAVLKQQKSELNIIAFATETNQLMDLASHTDPFGQTPSDPSKSTAPQRLSFPEQLSSTMDATAASETQVLPAITPVVQACR